MSAQIRRYLNENYDFEFRRGYTALEQQASNLRKNFLKKYIINYDTNLYKTQEERDWAYIAKREYNYDVVLRASGYSLMAANVVFAWRVFVKKQMVYWPLAVIPFVYLYAEPLLLQKFNKKLFDMCNLGEEFYLGAKRNEILKQCNQILDREDF